MQIATLTDKQLEAKQLCMTEAVFIMLFGGSRCVAGNTIIDGHTKTIAELAEIGKPIEVLTSWGKQLVEPPFSKGEMELLKITTDSGHEIEVTKNHRFWNGKTWVKACELSLYDNVGILPAYSEHPAHSIVEYVQQEFLSSVQRLSQKHEGLKVRYSEYCRQYDQQPHPLPMGDLTFDALRYDELERIQLNQFLPFLFSELHESDSQIHCFLRHVVKDSLLCPSQPPLSIEHGFQASCLEPQSLKSEFERIFLQFLGCNQEYQQFDLQYSLVESYRKLAHIYAYQFCQFFYLSYDLPFSYGYNLSRVISITETAKKRYYCLQVPTSEQYFANGFLNHNSGKTAFIVWLIIMRALKAPESRHCSLRFRFNHIKESIGLDTLPKVIRLFFPNLKYNLNKTDWYVSFPNGSEYWLGGLDDAQRVEKILGKEFATMHYNECSQIAWASVETSMTRLAQQAFMNIEGEKIQLQNRLLFDCNPPNNAHWTYQLFIKHIHPSTKKPLEPNNYLSLMMNPSDNLENIDKNYLQMLEGMSGHNKQRFLYGQFTDANPNALWNFDTIEKWRVIDNNKPQMIRIVVAVDPSGADEDQSKNNDDIGIMIVGLGIDGNCYVLEDCTCNAPPQVWGNVATTAFDRHQADIIVAETNYGGGMVKQVIQASRPRTPFQAVTASRGKHVRAEPISVLYEQGKVRHVGYFSELEEELCAFSTFGYTGAKSPNRADALIWAISELFPTTTNKVVKPTISLPKEKSYWR